VGGYGSPQAFVHGLAPALWVGVAMLGAGVLAVLALPFSTRAAAVGTAPVLSTRGAVLESAAEVSSQGRVPALGGAA
jgi:hypothetical protein